MAEYAYRVEQGVLNPLQGISRSELIYTSFIVQKKTNARKIHDPKFFITNCTFPEMYTITLQPKKCAKSFYQESRNEQ